MRYGSVCSGIEAATAAWEPLDWEAAFFSEVEAFPRAVLQHHYPDVPLHGDFTTIGADEYGPIDLLVGGTPCQSFSIAGLRGGLADSRGNLALEFCRLADRKRPRWVVWENVPGVLSSDGGRAFGSILGALAEIGYGLAYRVLDAQYFGVPQRRRRTFVVGYFGDARRAAAVLFERESLRGNPAPRREARESVTPTIAARTRGGGGLGADLDLDGGLIAAEVAPTLNAHFGVKQGLEDQHIDGGRECSLPSVAMCLNAGAMGRQDAESETLIPTNRCGFDVAHSLRAAGFDASEDGTGRGTPLVPVAMPAEIAGTLKACSGKSGQPNGAEEADRLVPVCFQSKASAHQSMNPRPVAPSLDVGKSDGVAIYFSSKDYDADAGEVAPTLRSMGHDGRHANGGGQVAIATQERAISENPDAGPQGSGIRTDGAAYTLEARHHVQVVAFDMRGREGGAQFEGPHDTANIRAASGGSSRSYVGEAVAVRRLTPKECERLMGFPDNFTAIPWRKKAAEDCPDGPRYKALGNSMAVPCMRWLGERIQLVDDLWSVL